MSAATADLSKPDLVDGTIIMRPSAKSTDRLAMSIRLFTRDDDTAVIQVRLQGRDACITGVDVPRIASIYSNIKQKVGG